MRLSQLIILAVVALALALGCSDDGLNVFVEVKTDLRPTREFAIAEVELLAELPADSLGGTVTRSARQTVAAADPFLTGRRVAELEDVTNGNHVLRVRLLDDEERPVASRIVLLDVREDLAVTVVITRDCAAVICPESTDPSGAISCVGGQCEAPNCEADGTCLPDECSAAGDCPTMAACALPACDDGLCLYEARDAECAADEACDVARDCVATSGGAGFRRRITIANGATQMLPSGYTIRVGLGGVTPLDSSPDLSDVRILTETAPPTDVGVDRIVDLDPPGQDRAVWFALPTPIAGEDTATYWLHYGDVIGGGAAPSDPSSVLPLFDDFRGGVLSPSWQTLATPTVSGSLTLGPGDTAVATDPTIDGVGPTSVFEARMRVMAADAANTYYWIGYQHTGGFGTGGPFINWVGRPGIVYPWVNVPSRTEQCADIPSDETVHVYRIERSPGTATYYRDGTFVCASMVDDSVDYAIQLRNQSETAMVEIDWVRVRELVSPEPEVRIGPEDDLAR